MRRLFRSPLAAALAGLMTVTVGSSPTPLHAQAASENEFLAAIQGRWVSRFPGDISEVEIQGREVRLVAIKPGQYGGGRSVYIPKPGDLIGVITGIKTQSTKRSDVDGRMIPQFEFIARKMTNWGNGWRLSDPSAFNYLNSYTQFCQDSPSSPTKPFADYQMLSGLFIGDAFRPEVKRRMFPPASSPNYATVIVPKCSSKRPTVGGPGSTTPRPAPAVTRPQAASTPAPAAPDSAQAAAPATSEQAQRELAERERLNQQQAAFAKKQLEQNEANRHAFEQAQREREAAIAKQKADYAAAVAATEAEKQRREREYAAAMARWQADVEACKKGDKTRCAPQ
ncbi:MAG: hypothetical protein O9272_16890 [Brevundimonas sp.]|nr:hypothetical protein [Brevundimonas sp.]